MINGMTAEVPFEGDTVKVTFKQDDAICDMEMTKKEYIQLVKGDNFIVRFFKKVFG